MCAPPSTLAVTAAAVPQSRSDGGRSPVADVRNDFLEGPTRMGQSSAASRSSPGDRLPRMLRPLGEAKAGVDDHRFARDASGNGAVDRGLELLDDLADDVVIDGLAIHVARPPAVVHQDDGCT